MKDIPSIKGKYYIRSLIEQGEHEHQDFKYAISDARKIARSISAFANNDGGRLLIGVKDNGSIVGIPNEEDIYMIEHAAEAYCYPPQKVEMTAFSTEGGAIVLRAVINRADKRPVYCLEEKNRKIAYFRVKDENIAAHPLMVKAWELLADSEAEPLSLRESDMPLLRLINETGETTVNDYILQAHISQHAAHSTIIRLMAMGIITMRHTTSGFTICHAQNPDNEQ